METKAGLEEMDLHACASVQKQSSVLRILNFGLVANYGSGVKMNNWVM